MARYQRTYTIVTADGEGDNATTAHVELVLRNGVSFGDVVSWSTTCVELNECDWCGHPIDKHDAPDHRGRGGPCLAVGCSCDEADLS